MEGPLSIWRGISNDFFPLPFILPGWKYAACGNAVPPSYWRPSILGAGIVSTIAALSFIP